MGLPLPSSVQQQLVLTFQEHECKIADSGSCVLALGGWCWIGDVTELLSAGQRSPPCQAGTGVSTEMGPGHMAGVRGESPQYFEEVDTLCLLRIYYDSAFAVDSFALQARH